MLVVENLTYCHAHSSSPALADINLTLAQGRALLVTGPSGSGKSTFLSILSGLVPHYYKGELRGRVSLNGLEPGSMPLAEWGFQAALMMQNPEAQFLAATVEEEIMLTLRCRNIPSGQAEILTAESLHRFGLAEIKNRSVFQLSEGQKQKVVLAALSALKPRLILLDEPTANLDQDSIRDLKEALSDLKGLGTMLVIADHRLHWLEGLCDDTLVLDQGLPVWQSRWSDFKREASSQAPFLRSIDQPETLQAPPQLEDSDGDQDIVVDNISFAYPGGDEIFSGFSARLKPGRVTVLTGPSGQGKTTLAKILCGLEKPTRGRLRPGPEEAAGQVVLQNADHQLYMASAKAEVDLALGVHHGRIKPYDQSLEILESFGLSDLAERHPQSLSGGEKQRLVVAVGQALPTRLLVLDEPTSGLDGRNLRLMADQIRQSALRGPAVLVITHDLELARLCADDYLRLGGGPRQSLARSEV